MQKDSFLLQDLGKIPYWVFAFCLRARCDSFSDKSLVFLNQKNSINNKLFDKVIIFLTL